MNTICSNVLIQLGWSLRNGTAFHDQHPTLGCVTIPRYGNTRAYRTLCAFVNAYIAAGFKIRLRNCNLMQFLGRVFSATYLRPHTMLSYYKERCTSLRSAVFNGHRGPYDAFDVIPKCWKSCSYTKALQVTFLGRSLPLPGKTVCDNSLSKFLGTVTTAPVHEEIPHGWETFLNVLPLPDPADQADWGLFSNSSCLGYSRKDGGRSKIFREAAAVLPARSLKVTVGGQLLPSDYTPRVPKEGKLPPLPFPQEAEWKMNTSNIVSLLTTDGKVNVSRTRNRALMLDGFSHPALAMPLRNDMEAISVKEIGYKARIVTKSQPGIVCRGHAERKRLWPLLERFTCIKDSLGDPPMVIRIKWYSDSGPRHGRRVISADFSAATDTIKHRVYEAFCKRFSIDGRLLYRDMFTNGESWKRGSPMGLPIGWIVLSLLHYHIAVAVDPDKNFRIRGDDLIAVWTASQWRSYVGICDSYGLVINTKKSFQSRKLGIFCEKIYRWDERTHSLRIDSSIHSLRFLAKEQTDYLSIGPTCQKFLAGGANGDRLRMLVRTNFPELFQLSKTLGIYPLAPSVFGGLDLALGKVERGGSIPLRLASHVHRTVNGQGNPLPRPKRRSGPYADAAAAVASRILYVDERTQPTCSCIEPIWARMVSILASVDTFQGRDRTRAWQRQGGLTMVRTIFKGYQYRTDARPLLGYTYNKLYAAQEFLKPGLKSVKSILGAGHGCGLSA
uniref:RNA-dependent RNA polymerase n=1 Tax=Plasmopara viticola lesion associated narnavirus 17 TaxID=2719500 RepID=A0A6G9RVF7_9VIRU|nr:RNA-dependent RNA polymerase [Plasmopara viticola lesion associated narnavirus 17]